MRSLTAWRAASAGLAFALAATLSGCTAQPLPNGSGKCEPSFDYAHKSKTKPGYIDGKVKVKCTFTKGSLTDLTIETKLQKKVNGTWVDASVPRKTIIAIVKSKVTYTGVSNFIPCAKGTFRTAGRGGAYLNGVYSGSDKWGYSGENRNPCG